MRYTARLSHQITSTPSRVQIETELKEQNNARGAQKYHYQVEKTSLPVSSCVKLSAILLGLSYRLHTLGGFSSLALVIPGFSE